MVMDFGRNGYTWWNGCIVLIFGVRERDGQHEGVAKLS
jgi:hypothetical protein